MAKEEESQTYAAAGVDIDAADRALDMIKAHIGTTLRPEVLSGVGFFGGLFELKGYLNPVLVSSADGVGTKLKIASALNIHDTVGIDLVNHCVNDILTCGAEPLFFLDYLGTGKLFPEQVSDAVKGLATACQEAGCALIGGETAEMPGIYARGDYDLVGFIVGVVEKERIIDGKTIEPGDDIIGLPSSGIHTNGYSLVRKIFDISPTSLNVFYPELRCTLGEELLRPHRCYLNEIKPLLPKIKGLAHITGGGLVDNIPRLLRPGIAAKIDQSKWEVPPVFKLIQRLGKIDVQEMYRVFNMGIGMAIICPPEETQDLMAALTNAKLIGRVEEGRGRVEFRGIG
ncbi:MAG: phosphoribosylformylglycinamidine cyclo-ligase [Dehalococcoidia bacterium]